MYEKMNEDEKKKEEEGQWLHTVRCKCPGHPAIHNKEGRVICTASIEVPQDDFSTFRKQQHATMKYLQDAGWLRMKTLGIQRRFCPACSTMIQDRRAKNKHRWGV